MKATKFLLVIAFLAFATMSYSVEKDLGQDAVKISLKKAMENRGLVQAIYQQVNLRDLITPGGINTTYIARVKFKHTNYVIYATYQEWVNFFVMDPFEEIREN